MNLVENIKKNIGTIYFFLYIVLFAITLELGYGTYFLLGSLAITIGYFYFNRNVLKTAYEFGKEQGHTLSKQKYEPIDDLKEAFKK